MGWLRDTFPVSGDDLIKVQIVQYVQTYILQILEGYLMSYKSQNLVHLRWLLKLINFRAAGELSWGWNYSPSYGRIPTVLKDIRLLLDQQLEAHVPLVNYATVEMHQKNKVLWKFEFQQPILVAPEVLDDEQVLDDEHKIDLRRSNTH
ncbi:hypothetical protein Gohar_007105 [Gossypium harknessii]|uniref:Uncharacterized protein n=1 Tax=Gossypium harknessii TaxID=34285 RepID=A0A7J9GG48_9ROSI|nr:hypothetical protein [Gossypium harknessii]